MKMLVSIHALWKYGNTGLQRPKIKEFCEKGILPCIKDEKTGRFLILAAGVKEALKIYAEKRSREIFDVSPSWKRRSKMRRNYSI